MLVKLNPSTTANYPPLIDGILGVPLPRAAGGLAPSRDRPNQVRAEEVDARTDLFSFGAVLYEMEISSPRDPDARMIGGRTVVLPPVAHDLLKVLDYS